MHFQLSHEAERRWVMVLIQLQMNRAAARPTSKTP